MRNIRLSKYTPQAANEVRKWIEDTLGERLAAGDLLEALKDGTALCKYAGLYNLLLFEPGMLMVFLLDSSTLLPNPGYASRNPRCHSFKWRTFHTFYARVNSLHWVFNPMTSSRQSISTNPRILLRYCNAFRLSAEERMPSNRVGFQPLSAKQVKVER